MFFLYHDGPKFTTIQQTTLYFCISQPSCFYTENAKTRLWQQPRAASIHNFNKLMGYPFLWKMKLHHWVSGAKLWGQCSGLKVLEIKAIVTPNTYYCKNLRTCLCALKFLHARNPSLSVLMPNSHFQKICYMYVVLFHFHLSRQNICFNFLPIYLYFLTSN